MAQLIDNTAALAALYDEVNALPTSGGTSEASIAAHNTDATAHADIREQISQLSSEKVNLSDAPFVTPQMYGARGDGVWDDTEAFEDALTNHSCVFVPSGRYNIKRPLNLTYHKSLYSDAGQPATIVYTGGTESDSVVLIGRLATFRNINIEVKAPFNGIIFNTNNLNMQSAMNGKHSRVEHVRVSFDKECSDAILIGITVDSGTDPNNMPINTGNCYQVFRDIVANSGTFYGTGIKMTLVQGREFTEETKEGYPWMTHIAYEDIYLGCPYTAIKVGVENTSGHELFNRVKMDNILFNNVSAQAIDAEKTRYFLDVNHIDAFFTKCIGWDYHSVVDENGNMLKANIIGKGAFLSFNDCTASFSQGGLLNSCEFIAEQETEFTVENNPSYFFQKYFRGSFLKDGYDSVDAKIDAKMADAYIADIAEEKINEILYSGYINILEYSSTQYKKDARFSNSSQSWEVRAGIMTIIIPAVKGGNIIRWRSDNCQLSTGFQSVFFFNDDELSEGTFIEEHTKLLVSDDTDMYLKVSNPNGYKYISIPFNYTGDVSSETMIMTINQKIVEGNGQSYTEYLRENVIDPAVSTKVEEELTGCAKIENAEEWTFTLADGSTVTKKVVLA